MTKKNLLLGAAAVLALGAARPTFADLSLSATNFKFAATHVAQGEHEMTRLSAMTTPAGRLAVLDRGIELLLLGWTDAEKGRTDAFAALRVQIDADLLPAYIAESEIYYARRSLPLAMARAKDALALDPLDPRALNLVAMVRAAQQADLFGKNEGGVAIDRVRARRDASGMLLRDRGGARGR